MSAVDPAVPPTSRRGAVAMAVVAVAIVAGILPAFLVAALAVEIRTELGVGDAAVGLVLAAFFAASAVASAPFGRFVDREGPRRAFRLALVAAGSLQVAIAVLGRSVAVLIVLSGCAGAANALAQLAANVHIANSVRARRQGLAFAIKQSAMPAASLVAGLMLPSLALTVGWRWAFVVGAVMAGGSAVAVGLLPGRVSRTISGAVPSSDARGPAVGAVGSGPVETALRWLAAAMALATASAVTLGGFFVSSTIDAGISPAGAGIAFSVGSALSILSRVVAGSLADRRSGRMLGVVAVMLALGALTYALFTVREPWAQLLGIPLAFGAGWAWPGLFNLSVVRSAPDRPGRASGITQTGAYTGAAVGPVLFGWIAEHHGYPAAWWLASAMALGASGAVLAARGLLDRRA